jgi:hypothetical protein
MLNIKIDEKSYLELITSLIHDDILDVDNIQLDNNGTLKIPVEYNDYINSNIIKKYLVYAKYSYPIRQSSLQINKVVNYTIYDKAKIGKYSFNMMNFSPINHTLHIYAEPYLKVDIIISSFNISFVVTDNVIKYNTIFKILGRHQ